MRIEELIKENGYTQKEFAEKSGMITVGLAQIIAGKPDTTSLTCPHCGKNINIKAECYGNEYK